MKALKKCILAAAMIPVVLGSASAFAHNGDKDRDGKRPMMQDCRPDGERDMMRKLNLTPEQRDQLHDIRHEQREEMRADMDAHRAQMQAFRAEEDKLLLSKDFSPEQAKALAKKMSDQQIERRVHMMENRHKMLSVLTPEQKAKWSELRAQGPKAFAECHFGKGGPDGDKHPQPPMEPKPAME
ncbi:CpxP family protein [Vibrio sp.]|uniref:Periplasmic repressor CpxP n=1 Tax=Vibrio viridaestus TaxID=2487322 RepID=A0A3N9TBZ1_9VIBR|nr:CpxP family protein [Vibrio viridaestus]MDC0610069.1 CpxP family protein [Vibrio sp.]RQW61334.1 periplasmic repressor CpxP [Vibrio viridaestus]